MSLFGKPAGTPGTPVGNLFGGASTTPTAVPTGGLFGSTTPAAPSGGLFGSTTPAAASGGLFGSTTPSTAPPSGGGLFGSATPAAPSAGGPGGGLFGSTTPATTSAPSGGLFGAGAATTTPAAPTTGGLFGSTTPAAPAPSTTGGGLFGSAAPVAAAPSTGGGGLFGSAAPAAAAPSGGLFSPSQATNTANTGRPGLFAGAGTTPGLGGTQQQQQQNMVPAATIDASKLTPTTRFGDCHQSVQQVLEQVEAEIESQIKMSKDLADRFSAHRDALETIPVDAKVLTHRLEATISFQTSDQAAAEQVRAQHEADNNAAQLSIRTLDLFRLPHAQRSQYIQRASTYSAPQRENEITGNKPMVAYFNKQADDMDHKMQMITRIVKQVEESLGSVEAQALQGAMGMGVDGRDITAVTGGVTGRQDARRLHSTLREFNDALRGVSGRIVDAQEALEALKGRR